MKKLVVLTGAGVSAESGIKTFRDSDGLWENYNVSEVATIEAWDVNPALMVQFYNMLRQKLKVAEPNDAHKIIGELEQYFDVTVVTQNIDNLHERGGSSKVIHLHGELTKVCSERGKRFVEDIGYEEYEYGRKSPDGGMTRPFIVWFGEDVPLLSEAAEEVEKADILVVIGTSLNVYPAAGLLYYAKPNCPIYLIDPKEVQPVTRRVEFIREKATVGMRILKEKLLQCK
ncbi:MAG: NAD-dependent protein deacylase [Bacteroidales bacterium]|nr:NAD-dependent protein deacylase [Bacteroidales bacterium]